MTKKKETLAEKTKLSLFEIRKLAKRVEDWEEIMKTREADVTPHIEVESRFETQITIRYVGHVGPIRLETFLGHEDWDYRAEAFHETKRIYLGRYEMESCDAGFSEPATINEERALQEIWEIANRKHDSTK